MKMIKKIISSTFIFLALFHFNSIANAQEEVAVQAFMTNAAVFVKNMEASLEFYKGYLGLMNRSDSEIIAGKSRDTLEIDQELDTRIVYPSPKPEFTEPGSFAGGLALIEVKNDAAREFNRLLYSIKVVHGETAMVFRVQNIN